MSVCATALSMGGNLVAAAMPGRPLVSPWVVIPLAALGMLLIAGYVLSIQRGDVPPSRRRLRTASGVLQMILLGLLAYATGTVPPASNRAFVMAWMLIIIVLAAVIALASLDIINNLRLGMHDRRARDESFARDLASDYMAKRAAGRSGDGGKSDADGAQSMEKDRGRPGSEG